MEMNGAKTEEELIEQIEEDAFAEHLRFEKLEDMAKDIEEEMKGAFMICYQCEKPCSHLFDDARCSDCTRLTREEIEGSP